MGISDVTVIVAMDQKGALGHDNQLIWHLPNDLAWFKTRTKNKPVVMGKNTALSIKKPLPHRLNVVLSRHPLPSELGVVVEIEDVGEKTTWEEIATIYTKVFFHATDFSQAFSFCHQALSHISSLEDEVMIIGGAQIYKQALEGGCVTMIDATHVENTFPVADTFFPKDLLKGFSLVKERVFYPDEKNAFKHTIAQYKKRIP